jgi:hypothetical protein
MPAVTLSFACPACQTSFQLTAEKPPQVVYCPLCQQALCRRRTAREAVPVAKGD